MSITKSFQDEQNFDQMHGRKDRIYRVHVVIKEIGEDTSASMSAYLQTGLVLTLKKELPEVVASTGFNAGSEAIFNKNGQAFSESFAYVGFFRNVRFQSY